MREDQRGSAIYYLFGSKVNSFSTYQPDVTGETRRIKANASMCRRARLWKTTTQNQQETFVLAFSLPAVWKRRGPRRLGVCVSVKEWKQKIWGKKPKKRHRQQLSAGAYACFFFFFDRILIIKAADCAGLISAGGTRGFSRDSPKSEAQRGAFSQICCHQAEHKIHVSVCIWVKLLNVFYCIVIGDYSSWAEECGIKPRDPHKAFFSLQFFSLILVSSVSHFSTPDGKIRAREPEKDSVDLNNTWLKSRYK